MSRRDWGSGSIDERSPGRWRVTVPLARDPLTGKRRRRRFTVQGTKRNAQAALIKALHERDHGGVDPDDVTTGEWLAHWIDQHVSDGALSPETEYNYRGILRNHLVPAFGGVRLQELNHEHVSSLKDELVKSRAPATVVRVLGVLNTALRSAVKQRLLASNPALDVPRPSLARGRRERRALDKDEIAELLRVVDRTAYDTVVRFALATGARQGELLGAKWEVLDLDTRSYRVIRALHRVKGEFELRPPKTDRSRRTIQLSASSVARLRDHQERQNAERLRLGATWEEHGLLFPDRRGGYWDRTLFSLGFRKLVRGSAIAAPDEVNFHTLRHTGASQLILAGVDVMTVSRRLGHTSTAFTMDVYGHLVAGQQDAAAEALDDLLG